MTNLVEKDSDLPALLLILAVILLLIGGTFGFAYRDGAFQGKPAVMENTRTTGNKTVFVPDEVHTAAPVDATGPENEKPGQSQGR